MYVPQPHFLRAWLPLGVAELSSKATAFVGQPLSTATAAAPPSSGNCFLTGVGMGLLSAVLTLGVCCPSLVSLDPVHTL